ncbi:MAG: hypothetical protein K1W26_04940, partial [Acetatifactor sp.]
FQAAQAAKRRAWGGNPNKIPAGQNEPIGEIWYCGRILLSVTANFLSLPSATFLENCNHKSLFLFFCYY